MGEVDPRLAEMIEQDLSASFTTAPDMDPPPGFSEGEGGFTALDATELKEDGTSSAVEWQYELIHTGTFAGLAPTKRTVVLMGVTLVRNDGNQFLHRRYIDWLSLFGQLGLTLSARPAVDQIYPEVVAEQATVVDAPKN